MIAINLCFSEGIIARDPSKKIIIIISGFRGGRKKGGFRVRSLTWRGNQKGESGRAKTKERNKGARRMVGTNERENGWVVGVQVFAVFCSRYTKWIGRLPPAHVGYT